MYQVVAFNGTATIADQINVNTTSMLSVFDTSYPFSHIVLRHLAVLMWHLINPLRDVYMRRILVFVVFVAARLTPAPVKIKYKSFRLLCTNPRS